ncbi:MAG: tRNA (adenosine(37)-N6)-dimethylallyltransferase MiaA [Candidatus Zipacnadales bacterium]
MDGCEASHFHAAHDRGVRRIGVSMVENTRKDTLQALVLAGPTAVGKTELGVRLAQELNAEIISADSRQVYRELDIGTAKPSAEQCAAVPHHLIDILDPRERYNAERFARDALACIENLHAQGKRPLIVGGTGFYIEALMYGFSSIPSIDPDVEARLEEEADRLGVPALYERLREVDAATAARLHSTDRQRILRALSVYESTGRPLSYFHETSPRTARVRVPAYIVVTRPRSELYYRIEKRVDQMVREGLIGEVKGLVQRYGWSAEGLKALGYRQFREYLEGRSSQAQAVALLKRDTRRYAKRQLTWFRGIQQAVWVDLSAAEAHQRVSKLLHTALAD